MWADNETDRDFLNFNGVAASAAEVIIQAKGRPVSIGVSGDWGVGKSSLIRLIRNSLASNQSVDVSKFVFVEFNAWLYQGYDDARAALTEAIVRKLSERAKSDTTVLDKVNALWKRVNWLRAAKLTASSGIALALGLPPLGLIGEALALGTRIAGSGIDTDALAAGDQIAARAGEEVSGLLKPAHDSSPPKEIDDLRSSFEETLAELGVTLVVLIDDLDRCLPETAISTLEAMRLFLFLKHTAFVIAADDQMIRHAVRRHFDEVDDRLVTNYFDKLIQVPIRVPQLGVHEVRAYMMLLFVEASDFDENEKEKIRAAVCSQLAQSWRGGRVDRAFMQRLRQDWPQVLVGQFDTAERLAPTMATATQIAGNPRLVKRFLNALAIRMSMSKAHGVGVDEAILAKMLLFERCGSSAAYTALSKAVSEDSEGKPRFLAEWENLACAGEEAVRNDPWKESFVTEWLGLSPRLADVDLRGVLYVSREHAPLMMSEDRLSSEGAEILNAILERPKMARNLSAKLSQLQPSETSIIMNRLLERARQEQSWGCPDILDACLSVAHVDKSQGLRLAGFLADRPTSQIQPSIIPKIKDEPWSAKVFERWESGASGPVKAAIQKAAS